MRRRTFLLTASALAAAPWAAQAEGFPLVRSEREWRAALSPDAYAVLRENKTEAAFSHPYNDESAAGLYHCAGCDTPVYASANKFWSDSGWPAFDRAISARTAEGPDPVYGEMLTEVHCATCGGHLGHVFNDGPAKTTGERHCINGTALTFRAGLA